MESAQTLPGQQPAKHRAGQLQAQVLSRQCVLYHTSCQQCKVLDTESLTVLAVLLSRLMAELSICFVQTECGEDEVYQTLVLGPSIYLDSLHEVDQSTLRWMSSLRKTGA